MRKRASIRVRLTAAVTVVTAVFLGAATFEFSARSSEAVLDAVKADQSLIQSSPFIGSLAPYAAEVYLSLQEQGLLPQFWGVLGQQAPPRAASVVIVDESVPPDLDPAVVGEREVVIAGEPGAGEVGLSAATVLSIGEPLLEGIAADDVVLVDDVIGVAGPLPAATDVEAVLAVPVTNVRGSVADIGRDLWLASAALTLLAAGATWVLTGRALRPVEAITRQVEVISAAGSGERVPVPPQHDEVGHLARTVNTMLDRLDRAALNQRRFVADASHELRSPLAVIRTEAEVALSHPDRADWPATARSVLEETQRLETLVSDLLVLAQRDDGRPAARLGTGETDVEEVVLAEAARTRRVPVDTSGVLAGRVGAHPGDVGRVVRHLLDNAARHATTVVQVSVRPQVGGVVLVVDDDGDGIADADRQRIFERFARLEESRSRDAGGAGLGLAVVAAIVGDLGGTVEVASAPIGGARFVVRLPATGESDVAG